MIAHTASTLGVQAGLIMRRVEEGFEVLVASRDNPYEPAKEEKTVTNLLRETLSNNHDILHVPDIRTDARSAGSPGASNGIASYLGMPIRWPDNEIFGAICVLDDREHEYSASDIELLTLFRQILQGDLGMLLEHHELQKLSAEKTMALKEAHHRIKNHLNMLIGVLHLNEYKDLSPNEATRELIEDMSSRIRAIAGLHSFIAMAEDSQVDLEHFLQTIAKTIIRSIAGRDIELKFEAEPIEVNRRTFFHTGLLVSELITNAVKHAFADIEDPKISISLKERDKNIFTLIFRDNGSGIPKGLSVKDGKSIGMILINDLPAQIGGSYTIDSEDGTTYEFNLKKRSGQADAVQAPAV